MRLALLLALLLCGCSLQEDFKYASKSGLIAVNGILHPDSTITIRVSRTAPYPNGDSFISVEGASVKLYKNDSLLGELVYSADQKAYTLDYRPKESHTYRLLVHMNGHDSLVASTSIPQNSTVEACYTQFPEGENIILNDKANLHTFIKRNDPAAVIWIGMTCTRFSYYQSQNPHRIFIDSTTTSTDVLGALYSPSLYIDPFNGYRDEGLDAYDKYLRLSPAQSLEEYRVDVFSRETNVFFSYSILERLHERLGLYLHVYTVSDEYDRFLKNAVLVYLNSNIGADIPNPFVEQNVNYSNVKGGTGVFAGYNSRTMGVHKLKCQ